jgi:hypothetical protein
MTLCKMALAVAAGPVAKVCNFRRIAHRSTGTARASNPETTESADNQRAQLNASHGGPDRVMSVLTRRSSTLSLL